MFQFNVRVAEGGISSSGKGLGEVGGSGVAGEGRVDGVGYSRQEFVFPAVFRAAWQILRCR